MAEKQNTPEIRFEGFTDPWEQRKFADFVTASGIRNSENLDLPSYSVTNNRGFVPQDEQFENGGTMREADKTSYWIVEPNSFAYNPARINVGSIGYQSTSGNVIVSSLYEVFRTDETCDDHFLWYWFKTRLFTRQIEMLQEGGVRLYFFFDKLLKSGISMPSVDEQRLIGEQFDWLDSLITLHQRKYDKLCTVKKSMLDKMFPKPGETEPEIRFEGFTDPWEQRKLGEFGSVAMCKRIYKEQTSEQGDVPFFKIGTFGTNPDAFISNELFDYFKRTYPYPTPGTLLISAAGSIGRVVEYQGEKAYFQDSNIVWLEHDQRLNDTFLKPLYSQIEWGLEGSTIKRLYNKDLLSAEVTIPGSREQKEIGRFFAKLDDLITLHQRKLDLLKNMKKSLLDKMFV